MICTVGHLVWHFIQGWLAAPLTYLLLFFVGRSFPRDSNPGWGDWRRSLFVFWVCCGFCFVLLAIFKSVRFAFHATGLDAVQRLEQKKGLPHEMAGSRPVLPCFLDPDGYFTAPS